jgi:hypothetical protein
VAELLAEAAEGTVLIHRTPEILPVHVRNIQVVIDAPQLRRDASERRPAAVLQQVNDGPGPL